MKDPLELFDIIGITQVPNSILPEQIKCIFLKAIKAYIDGEYCLEDLAHVCELLMGTAHIYDLLDTELGAAILNIAEVNYYLQTGKGNAPFVEQVLDEISRLLTRSNL